MRKARRRGLVYCIAAALALTVAGAPAVTAVATRDRTISLYNIHTKETLTIQYMKDGRQIPEAMEKINWILRDWRKDEPTKMDPELIDLLWEIHNELGSHEPIHIISGYRSRGTNEMLRATVGGQASQSRHIMGKAADVHFPDIPIKQLRYSALIHERGGVGYYPTSAIPFVHVDTDRVRAWPRLPRTELALLFPSGHTQHVPDDGEPITRDDVRRARAANTELATQIAAFHQLRANPKTFQVASLGPSLPQLLSPPKPAQRPAAAGTRPSDAERARLAELAAEPPPRLVAEPTPVSRRQTWDGVVRTGEMRVAATDPRADAGAMQRLIADTQLSQERTFAAAPAFDEDHPEELSYRPYPIASLLTATSSADDAALTRLVHPDLAKTLEMLDARAMLPPMRMGATSQTAQAMWAQQFRGETVTLSSFIDAETSAIPAWIANRKVHTQAQ